MTSYQKLKEEKRELREENNYLWTKLFMAKNALWEIEALKDGEEWKAPELARTTLRIIKDEDTKNRK